jgi:hypothetical protein
MSYCKWRNSLSDLYDIKRRLDETYSPDDVEGVEERKAYDELIELIGRLAEDYA